MSLFLWLSRRSKQTVSNRRLQITLLMAILCLPAGFVPQTQKKHSPTKKTQTKKKTVARPTSSKLGHINRAFVASADLKPMAKQLLENRTPQGYAAVEAYARKHSTDGAAADAGALAWLVLGYAHYLDKDYAGALDAWKQTSALEPVLGDYLAWLRA